MKNISKDYSTVWSISLWCLQELDGVLAGGFVQIIKNIYLFRVDVQYFGNSLLRCVKGTVHPKLKPLGSSSSGSLVHCQTVLWELFSFRDETSPSPHGREAS